jgi:thiol-disulfide isomerase/thioredoxin
MYKNLLVSIVVLFFAVTTGSKVSIDKKNEDKRDIPVLNFESLAPLLQTDTEEIQIINFWAMWCAPCVKELPILEAYQKKHPNVKITLVSMDFPEDIETKLKPFLKKKGITAKVVLLDDPDANSWIDKVDPNWSGAIPFTIIFNNKKRFYHERMFESLEDLENEVKKIN